MGDDDDGRRRRQATAATDGGRRRRTMATDDKDGGRRRRALTTISHSLVPLPSVLIPSRRRLPRHRQGAKGLFLALIKILPLAIYLRSAACKFGLPALGCDGELCPVAIGKPGDCVPTANTAEQRAWCEHAWVPWTNGLLKSAGVDYAVKCSAENNFEYAQIIGAIEVAGYLLLWVFPQLGGFILTVVMTGAIHFHLTFLKDKPEALVVQFALVAASALVMLLGGADAPAAAAAKKAKRS